MIATATYADPGLRQLRAPAQDAAELVQVLADADIGGFTVITMADESAQAIRLAIEDFLADRGTEDLVLIYLSCHGLLDRHRRLFFAASDTRKDRLGATGVEAAWILDQLEHCRARRQILVLDSCFSGAFARGAKGVADVGLQDRLVGHGRGRVVLTASNDTEYSFEGDPVGTAAKTGSVFTAALAAGLRTGDADIDGDGYISVDDAYAYAYDRVRAIGAAQTPQRWFHGAEGKILLARSPAGRVVTPAPLPEAVRAALESPYPGIRVGAVHELEVWLTSSDPAQALTARAQLRHVAGRDIPQVAEVAQSLLQADREPGRAIAAEGGTSAGRDLRRQQPGPAALGTASTVRGYHPPQQPSAGTADRPAFAANPAHPSAKPGTASPQASPEDSSQEETRLTDTEEPDEDAAGRALTVLLVAREPLTRTELADVLDTPLEDLDEALAPISQFLRGTTSLELDPSSRGAVGRAVHPGARQRGRRRLLDWAASFADAGWPDSTPDYVVANHAAHLRESGDSEALYVLLSQQWMDLRLARSASHDGFAQDVLLAVDAAALDHPPNWIQMLRGSLIYATLMSLASRQLPSEGIVLLIDLGLVSQAAGYADAAALRSPFAGCEIYCKLAMALTHAGKTADARSAAARAFRMFEEGFDSLADELAAALAVTGLTEQARTVAEKALDTAARAVILKELNYHTAFEALSAAGLPERIIDTAERIMTAESISDRKMSPHIIEMAARALGKCGRTDLGLQIAQRSENEYRRNNAVKDIVLGLIDGERIDEAITVADKITDDSTRSFVLAHAADALIRTGGSDHAISVAKRIERSHKGKVLAHAAVAFTRAGHADRGAEVGEQALKATSDAVQLADLAVTLQNAGHSGLSAAAGDRALSAAEAATDDYRARTSAEVAARLLEAGQADRAARAADHALSSADSIDLEQRIGVLSDAAEVLISAGQADRAITVARRAAEAAEGPVRDGKITAFAQAANVLNKTGHATEAAQMADRALAAAADEIPGSFGGVSVDLLRGCEILAKAGYADQALAAAQSWDARSSGIEVTLSFTSALAKSGEAGTALAIAESVSGDEARTKIQTGIARALFESGQKAQALDLINRLRTLRRGLAESWRRVDLLRTLAHAAVQSGHLDQALAVADKARDTIHAVGKNPREEHQLVSITGVYTSISGKLAEAGRADEAMTAAEQALSAARQLPATASEFDHAYALRAACGALAGTGQVAQALAAANEVSDPWVRAQSLTSIAGALARNRQEAQAVTVALRAFEIVGTVPDDSLRSLALNRLAQTLAGAGQARQAQILAGRITEPWIKARSLVSIADAAIDNGDLGEAKEISEQVLAISHQIGDGTNKADVLGAVAQLLARAGQTDQAAIVAEQALATYDALPRDKHTRYRSAPLGIFAALALAGREEQALMLAENQGDRWKISSALQQITEELIRANKVDQSIVPAEKMAETDINKAATLAWVADAFASAGQTDQASLVTARALESSRIAGRESFFRMLWSILPVLQRIAPHIALESVIEPLSDTDKWLISSL